MEKSRGGTPGFLDRGSFVHLPFQVCIALNLAWLRRAPWAARIDDVGKIATGEK